jgi:hypothetical protein
MKNAVGMVGIVAVYSLLEVGLLFSLMLITSSYSASATYQASVFWGQLLPIPGSAALMSRIVYGPHGWARRALNNLVVGALGVPILFLILIAVLSLLDWVSSVTWTSTSPIVFFAAVALLAGAGVITAVVLVIKKGVRYSLRLEAARWLDERHAGSNRVQSRWRRRAIHHAPWVPATTVLLLFLFLPEVWGLLSHLSHPRSGKLSGYRVSIPATWIILSHNDQRRTGKSLLEGLAGRGIGFGPTPYLRADVPLFSWVIGTVRYDWPAEVNDSSRRLADDFISTRRDFKIGSESVTCYEYWPSLLAQPDRIDDSTIAFVKCSGASRLYASLIGKRMHIPIFYQMLSSISRIEGN